MTKRTEFIKDIFYNGKNGTWNDYAIKYDFKDGRTANDFWRFFVKNGSVEGQWVPNKISTPSFEDNIEEEEIEKEVNAQEFSEENISKNIISSAIWEEFLQFKASKRKADFLPGRHLILPCVHVPFENKDLMKSCLELITDIQPEGLHIIGDFLDMNSLSFHDKGNIPIEGITLDYEYKQGNILLDKIESAGNFKKKSFISGNHEARYGKHMSKGDNAKYGSALISPFTALDLENRGYEVETNWQEGVIYLGNYLELTHGNFFNVHSAKKHLDAYKTSVIYAHTHHVQSFVEAGIGAYNIGWMGDSNTAAFNYASRSMKKNWSNGFAIVNIDEDGYYFVEQIMWQNGKFYYAGKKY